MISQTTIELVRERTDIVAVVEERVPSLKKRGRTYVGLCPFHKEKTGSFHVNPDRGFFHCFGCKESGSVIDFVMKHDGSTFPEAVRQLAEREGITIEEDRAGDPHAEAAERARRYKEQLYAANEVAASYFEEQLRTHPGHREALDELAKRGLVPGEDRQVDDVLQAFRIGFAPPGWDGLASHFRAQGISPSVGEALGLLVPKSSGGHYDRFRSRLMFAVVDPQGRVVGFSGRTLPAGQQPGKDPPPKYVNSPESPIYSKGALLFGLYQARHAVRAEGCAVVVEGNFDVVSLHARGIAKVVAPLGTAFTLDQAKLLKRFCPSVTLFFDGDAAGRKATRLSREPGREAGLLLRVATLPDGEDPDTLVRGPGGATRVLEMLKAARGMLEFLIDDALDESFVAADAYARAERVERVARLLATENDPIVRSMAKSYADKLAGRLDLVRSSEAFRALEATVRKALAEVRVETPRSDPRTVRIASKPLGHEQRRAIAGALVEHPELVWDIDLEPILNMLEGPAAQVVAALLQARKIDAQGKIALSPADFLAQIPESIQGFASERLAAPVYDDLASAKEAILENGSKLRKLLVGKEAEEIAREQTKAVGDPEAEKTLAHDAMERVRQKHGLK